MASADRSLPRQDVRFRVEIGSDLMYAGAWGHSLDRVLREAAHYVLVASTEAPDA